MNSKKIVFLNQKGGVGKTASAVNIGSELASMDYKVLLVDLDSQGNLSLSISVDSGKPGIYEVMAGTADKSCVQTTPIKNLYCLSGGINMAGAEMELASVPKREFFLKNALKPFDSDYDYILLDCPPALGLVTLNALTYTDYVIIPMQCEFLAMEGLSLLSRTINSVKKSLNPDLKVLGIVFTMFSKRNRLNAQVIEDVSSYFKNEVFKTVIPRSVRLAEAPSHGLPINAYASSSTGSKAYSELTKEVLERVGE